MPWYQRFFVGILTTILAVVLAYGFWNFNREMMRVAGIDKKSVRIETKKDIKEIKGIKEVEKEINEIREIKDIQDIEDERVDENEPNSNESELILWTVPFTSQAPMAEWNDPVFQDGCEEAVTIMAMSWVRGNDLSKSEARRKIVEIANWQKEKYGEFRDTAAEDTAKRIFEEYYGYDKTEVAVINSYDDIVRELRGGRIVIVPADGQLLYNPNYTAPGPERHNLLVIGYDGESKEFITNDPGTRNGAGYRYKQDVLMAAARDYLSGDKVFIEETVKKMIVVSKE